MMPVVSVAVRATLLLGVGLIALRALRGTTAATRRSVLVFTLLAVIALPLATSALPAVHLGRPTRPAATGPSVHAVSVPDAIADAVGTSPQTAVAAPSAPSPTSPSTPLPLPLVLAIVWALGAAGVLARTVVGHVRARRMARAGTLVTLRTVGRRVVQIRTSTAIDTPAVTGVFAPAVLLPRESAEWSSERMQLVLAHELAHVARRDCLVAVLSQLVCAVHWFNPLAWIAARRLRIESEIAADDHVLATGAIPSTYAEHLLHLATLDHQHVPVGALAMAEPTQIEQRIRALLAPGARALGRTSKLVLIAAGAALTAFVACASTDPAPTTPPDTSSRTTVIAAPPLDEATQATDHSALAFDESIRSIATIDPAVQAIITEEHEKLVATWGPCASIVIVLDPQTGHVVGLSARGGTEKTAELAAVRAMTPGSTMKPLVIAAALDEGAITTTETFDASQSGPDANVIHDSAPHGMLTAQQILTVSSNIGLAKVFRKMGGAHLVAWNKRFHLASAPATVSDDNLGATVAFGARITSNPLEMTAAFATLANGGIYHAPSFTAATERGERVVRTETASTVLAMLESVTKDGGTGTAAHVDGVRVAGKTGTANLGNDETKLNYYSSFVGTAPIEHPRYVVFVGAETPRDGGTGGQVAAPAFGRIMARLLAR
ncbi:MAG TPA: penicillin-binding transpeptidase domain-containing protein [Kofleriaceae bacterium]|jgi:cell division protein FtsI (penicillin-binding protein 3)